VRDARIRFDNRTPFALELQRRVDGYFEQAGEQPRDSGRMFRKSAILLGWWLASVVAFLVLDVGWLGTLGLAASLGLAMAGLGMAVQHDGGHRAYSERKWLNKAMARVLDLLGSSSYIWHHKHNVMHHTYPNVAGADDDVDLGVLARLAPESARLPHHRWQHLYMWPLYAFITIKWHWIDDFRQLAAGRIGQHDFPRPRGRELALFWGGKAVFFGWAVALPLLLKPLGLAVLFYFASQLLLGLVLSVTFQLAHCVEEASYFETPADGRPATLDFTRHQIETTIDFAPRSPLATWYMGGLNFQAVHHVFPRICHVHYPAISRIIAEVSAEHGVHYRPTPTLWAALRSHYRHLRSLGAAPAPMTLTAQESAVS
jgi:linoleoyl-CoA desaturase